MITSLRKRMKFGKVKHDHEKSYGANQSDSRAGKNHTF
jgi:hypothetical protein